MLVKVIKQDALVNIKVGTGFIQKLQNLLMYIAQDLSEEQLEVYKNLTEKKEEYTEDWMNHLYTVSILLKEIEDQAEIQNFISENNIEDIAIPEDN